MSPRSLYVIDKKFSNYDDDDDDQSFKTYKILLEKNQNLETHVECVGSTLNQSCLLKNLYYSDGIFRILTTKKVVYPLPSVRVGAWTQTALTPERRRFYSSKELEDFVRLKINPMVIPKLTLYFDQPWVSNIGHALFDGLYPAYLALIRFPPRHLQPFRLLVSTNIEMADSSFSHQVYHRFAGLPTMNFSILQDMSRGKWFAFEEIVMGSGSLCQRCLQPNLQLPGGIELNGSRLFRDRMYKQHGLTPPNKSVIDKQQQQPLKGFIIDNKRFTEDDKIEILDAIEEINRDPLIRISYISYPSVTILENQTKMMAHLSLLKQMNIHISAPGTGQMYQTFLSDGSVHINLGGLWRRKLNNTIENYTSFLEQYMTAGTPYIKGLYYPIDQRIKGIQKRILIQLIQEAISIIRNGFSIPVDPKENLAPDGHLFIEMCQLDEIFCKTVTQRWENSEYRCIDTWPEEIIYELGPWSIEGIRADDNKTIKCSFDRTLMHKLRQKYKI